ERRLIVAGDTLSVYPLGGKWDRVTREYWWHAIDAAPVPARPSALFVGLGGGTSLHVLRARCRPRSVTVIERDPVILEAAHDWFGLERVPGVEYLTGEADVVGRPRNPGNCPRTTPRGPRPRRRACGWRCGRGTSGRG